MANYTKNSPKKLLELYIMPNPAPERMWRGSSKTRPMPTI